MLPIDIYFYNSTIKVWDLQAALDPRAPTSNLCLEAFLVGLNVSFV